MGGRTPARIAAVRPTARHARYFVLQRRFLAHRSAPAGQTFQPDLRSRKPRHPAERRRAAHRTHGARGDERTVRLRPAGLDPAGRPGRSRRPRTANPPRLRRPDDHRARPPEHQPFPPRRRPSDPQPCMIRLLTQDGRLRHLLTLDGLPRAIITQILDTAESFMDVGEREVKKVPLLRGKSIFNLFFEPSTRTRTTFEIAAKRLSADVVNLNIATSSQTKGEAILDTVDNLSAMHADLFIVRHSQSGAAHFIAQHVAPHISVVNAGDGRHAHPTQGLLDMFTVRRFKGEYLNLTEAIVGDVL